MDGRQDWDDLTLLLCTNSLMTGKRGDNHSIYASSGFVDWADCCCCSVMTPLTHKYSVHESKLIFSFFLHCIALHADGMVWHGMATTTRVRRGAVACSVRVLYI
ncbi:uncharacterized protein K452DRAFT_44494 [Aplosporella prunicola CBS 121167]|uniref:Uncharacterized protein n=1 Tax=Aplosporella prunicola CBS 121167 TaxID=1176127 RepID=A0A6A6BAK5_9PEZI|nr:uncharacterized protein K452DRAFT_44494 [Aplosporella prunicola CBS 121167]KAF2141056.1 hypothetical protein K452DRAFT_44494 [Aplosporella prunicola CBS 121167]